MRIIPKASKVKVTFYKGITLVDIVLAIISLALVALILSTNFSFRWYLAMTVTVVVVPLYFTIGDKRLYVQIGYFIRYIFSRHKYSKDKEGSSDIEFIIPYREVRNSIVWNKDGSAFGVVEIEPVNFTILDEERQNELIDYCYSKVLDNVSLDEEWMLLKLEMPLVLDEKIREEVYRAEHIRDGRLSERYTDKEFVSRTDLTESRIQDIDEINSQDIRKPRYFLCLIGTNTNEIRRKLDVVVSVFANSNIRLHVLDDDELNVFIKAQYADDYDIRREMKTISTPKECTFGVTVTKEDGKQISHLIITKYPLQVRNAWASEIFQCENTKVSMRMKPIDKSKAIKRIDNAILELETKNVGKESEYIEADSHVETLRNLLTDIQQSDETLFDVTTIISVYDAPKSAVNRRKIKDILREEGFSYSEMVGRQEDAYVSSLVSRKEMTDTAHGIQTSSLAAAFPFCSDEMIEKGGIILGYNSLPAFPDFFKRDLTHVNSNMVIIGQSGSGKSYATKTLLSNMATDGTKIYVLDPESEYGNLAENLGGSVIDASNGNKGRINPFEITTSVDDEGVESNSYYAQLQFLEQFYKIVLKGISQDSLEMLNKLTEEVYQKKDIRPGRDLSRLKSSDYPTFEDLYNLADEKLKTAGDSYEENCIRTILNYLSRFRKGGRDSGLWNGCTTFSPKENFITFDFQRLLANKNDVTANAQMLLLLRWIENEVIRNRDSNEKEGIKQKIVVAIDEAHLFIDEKYPIALDFMYQLAKRIRKYDGMLIIITQNIRDFAGTPETERKSTAIINVSQYSMIFALSPNDMTELTKLYQNAGGINEVEKETIIHNPRGTCFLISSPRERGTLSIMATTFQESLFEKKN